MTNIVLATASVTHQESRISDSLRLFCPGHVLNAITTTIFVAMKFLGLLPVVLYHHAVLARTDQAI